MLEQLQKEFDEKFTWHYLPYKRHLRGDGNQYYEELITWIDKNFVPAETLVSQAASQSLPEPNQQSKVCVWRSIEDEYYDTTCKRSVYFEDGSLEGKPDYKYCPYCGKEILNEKKQLCEK